MDCPAQKPIPFGEAHGAVCLIQESVNPPPPPPLGRKKKKRNKERKTRGLTRGDAWITWSRVSFPRETVFPAKFSARSFHWPKETGDERESNMAVEADLCERLLTPKLREKRHLWYRFSIAWVLKRILLRVVVLGCKENSCSGCKTLKWRPSYRRTTVQESQLW